MALLDKINCKLHGMLKCENEEARKDKEIYDNKTNKELDKTLDDSFPASDPPANY